MTDRPALFSRPMVRALLNGSKTQTRRLCALPDPSAPIIEMVKVASDAKTGRTIFEMKDAAGQHVAIRKSKQFITSQFSPRIAVGDRLYVREHWRTEARYDGIAPRDLGQDAIVSYEANYDREPNDGCRGRFRQGMHMPRWASRLTLTVTEVRVQRLQDISKSDALAEGVVEFFRGPERLGWPAAASDDAIAAAGELGIDGPVEMYRDLWEHINGKGSWDANPWVAAYTFTVQHGNIDQLARAA